MATILHEPENERPIGEVWAVLSHDRHGNEGIVAAGIPGLGMTPLVTGDPGKAEVIWKIAVQEPLLKGKQLRLVRYVRVGILRQETI